jgi:hypothetical protein
MGIVKSTIPDVCKTPSPGGPVPIPYPVIISMSNSLAKGTKTVKVDGKKMAAVKGSELSRCNGDEPGTAGGVKSSTNMKEATWLLYSFDVKLDGKNACRLSDKLMMNHGNSACLAGIQQVPVLGAQTDPECYVACAIICCDEAKYKKDKHKDVPTKSGGVKTGAEMDCTSLSRTKHSCVLHALRERSGRKATTKNKFDGVEASPPGIQVNGEDVIPDIIVNEDHVIDAKFPCDKSQKVAPLNNEKCPSKPISALSSEVDTRKEDTVYSEIERDGKKVKKSEGMTPSDAKKRHKKKGCNDCDCEYEDA